MNPTTTAPAVALEAALALAALVPADVPLGVRPRTDDDVAAAGAGVGAKVVGQLGAEITLVVGSAVDAVLASSGGTLADVLRPALEAAATSLEEGVLSDVRDVRATEGAFVADGVEVFALTAGDEVAGWFGVRVTSTATPATGKPAAQAAAKVAAPGPNPAALRMLYDVELTLTAEIGRARLPVRQVLDLVPGAVVELDRVAGSPADLMVNGHLVARGEVVVVDEDYGLRITEIVDLSSAGF